LTFPEIFDDCEKTDEKSTPYMPRAGIQPIPSNSGDSHPKEEADSAREHKRGLVL
jgi:hypothetical protein